MSSTRCAKRGLRFGSSDQQWRRLFRRVIEGRRAILHHCGSPPLGSLRVPCRRVYAPALRVYFGDRVALDTLRQVV